MSHGPFTVPIMRCGYNLLVVDLDGTLMGSDGRVSEQNRRAIDMSRKAGLEVIIATGRSFVECQHVLEAIQHRGLVIAASGSLLCDASTGSTVDRHPLPQDVVIEITQSLVANGHKALILKDSYRTGYDYLAVGPSRLDAASEWWFRTLPVKVRFVDSLDEDDHPGDSVRAGAVACETALSPLAKCLKTQMGGRCCLQHWSAVTESHAVGSVTHLLEVFMPNVNKWTMVAAHCQRQGIDLSKVAAIGDGLNDVELVANAGLGIAMANAVPEVRAAADWIVGDYRRHGVAEAIDAILNGEIVLGDPSPVTRSF